MGQTFFIFSILLSASVGFAETTLESIQQFYNQISACQPLTLECLEEKNLIESLGENVFRLTASKQPQPREVATAKSFASFNQSPVLLIQSLPGMRFLPIYDAITFTDDGMPWANVSFRTRLEPFPNWTGEIEWIRAAVNKARETLRNGAKQFEDSQRTLSGEAREFHRRSDILEMKASDFSGYVAAQVSAILGLTENSSRPAWNVIDVRSTVPQRALQIGKETKSSVQSTVLRMTNLDGTPNTSKQTLQIDSLSQSAFMPGEYRHHFFLVGDRKVVTSPDQAVLYNSNGRWERFPICGLAL